MHEVRSIQELLHQIRRSEILLPEFQRGYVWSRAQVRGLMQSLYRKHPTGHLLIWRTYRPAPARGDDAAKHSHSLMLLDGQQRLTTLYVLFEGKAPPFYEGESLFFDLYFNMQTEEFRFWQKSLMEKNPAWISIHEFLRAGLNSLLEKLDSLEAEQRGVIGRNLGRLSRLDMIRNYNYTVDKVSGDEFTVEEVVSIFNRVNRAGTPLTKADVALAHVCSIWPEARAEMRTFQSEMSGHGFAVDFNFLVRCLAGVATGSIVLEGSFLKAPAEDLQAAWNEMQAAFEHLVNVLRHEAFIDDLSDLPTNYVLVPLTIYLAQQRGRFPTDLIKKRFIRWLYLAGLWARYSGAAETKLQQDVALVSSRDKDPTPELEGAILKERGRVALEGSDLAEVGIASAVARFSYVLARSRGAQDWFTGIQLYNKAIGKRNGLESHHIFPRAVLRDAGFNPTSDRKIINELANRAFLTQKANRAIASTSPINYLPKVEESQPGALQAQCVPMDRTLWDPENYTDFLRVRRQLLAQAVNTFIAGLVSVGGSDNLDELQARRLMESGESKILEFKSSLRWDVKENRVNRYLERVITKSMAGFLNAKNGGTLLIGVDDDGNPVGLYQDYSSLRKKDRDGFELHLGQLVARDLGESVSPFLTVTFHEIDGKDVCQVTIDPSDHPVYHLDGNETALYLRAGNATRPLPVPEAVQYVQNRWGPKP